MNKLDIKFQLLNLFNDEEINTICKNTDLNMFLVPIKNKRYDKYSKKLGRLNKKSILVQKLLPKMAFELYKKNEEPFKATVAVILQEYQEKFLQDITDCMEPPITIDELRAYTPEQVADFYFKFLDVTTSDIPEDLFFIFLKLQGIQCSEEQKKNIEIDIVQKRNERFAEEKRKAEIADALKKLEKELTSSHRLEQDELKQQIKEYRIQYEECFSQKNAIQRQLDLLKAGIEYDRREMESEWQEQYEKLIQERKLADEEKFRQKREKAEKSHCDFLAQLEVEAEQQRKVLHDNYNIQLRESQEKLACELEVLEKRVKELTDDRDYLVSEVDELNKQKEALESKIGSLRNAENSYFATFEKRIIEKKIDKLIFNKLGILEGEKNSEPASSIGFSMISAKTFAKETEYGDTIENIEDFLEDYTDNISIHFDNETEISVAVIAALVRGMALIASNPVCSHLAEAFLL